MRRIGGAHRILHELIAPTIVMQSIVGIQRGQVIVRNPLVFQRFNDHILVRMNINGSSTGNYCVEVLLMVLGGAGAPRLGDLLGNRRDGPIVLIFKLVGVALLQVEAFGLVVVAQAVRIWGVLVSIS